MNNIDDGLAFVINIHQRLVRDFPKTPYCLWCDWVHTQSFTPQEKWDRILSWKINPSEYENPTLFAADWQLNKLLSKFSSGGLPTELEKDVAYRKFLSAEERCFEINQTYTSAVLPRGINELLLNVKTIVASVLGDIDEFFKYVETYETGSHNAFVRISRYEHMRVVAWDSVVSPEFGPGVSVGRADKESGKPDRLSSLSEKLVTGTVTADCAYIANWLSTLWNLPTASITRGSVLTFVLKKVGEARTICYEASMNMLIQKLLGRYLKHRLKVCLGIDLSKQQRNRMTARLGSLCDSWATADQSSASDLFAYQYVLETLPFPWFKFMDDIRSKEYFDPMTNCWKPFHKFSTMGNGFTFELETLLFAAIIKASITVFDGETLPNRDLIVYGDDLIFPKRFACTVEQALLVSGHLPNHEKSFASGNFRESCGGDFFKGWNVTPFKIKEVNIEDPRSVVNCYNGLVAISSDVLNHQCVSSWFSRALLFIKRRLRERHPNLSDGPIEIAYDESLLEYVASPSNRWFWAIEPEHTYNNVWSSSLQCIVPKHILCEVKKSFADYDLPEGAIGYFAEHSGKPPGLSVTEVKLVRNPDILGHTIKSSYRPKAERGKRDKKLIASYLHHTNRAESAIC